MDISLLNRMPKFFTLFYFAWQAISFYTTFISQLFCFAATTRFVQCDKCDHFFLILSEADSAKRYIHVHYDKASSNEGEKQGKALQSPPPPPRKVIMAWVNVMTELTWNRLNQLTHHHIISMWIPHHNANTVLKNLNPWRFLVQLRVSQLGLS